MTRKAEKIWPVFRTLQGGAASWRADALAGLTLAAIAAPEQMATARLGGFPPHVGFYVFIAGSLAFALFGANRYLSAGADSTITPIFAASLAAMAASGSPDYLIFAALLSIVVGLFVGGAGLFRAGWVANLFSIPVLTGFLGGIAIHIVLSQAPAFLGLAAGTGPNLRRAVHLVSQIHQANGLSVLTGLACLGGIVLIERLNSRLPGALLALVGATVATFAFGLESRGLRTVGVFHVTPPSLSIPVVDPDDFARIVGLAAIVSVIIMVQSAATARSFPGLPGENPDIDRDFLGLGMGSILAGAFGAFPVNASPPRTAIVAEAGAKTQISGLVAAAAVALLALYGESFLGHAPEAALAAILFYIAGRIFRVSAMRDVAARSRPEFLLLLATLLLVALVPIQTGVALAIILSLIHGLWTTTRSDIQIFRRLPGKTVWWPPDAALEGETLEGVKVVGFQAPLSFLNADRFRRQLEEAADEPGLALLVLEASAIDSIDYTAAQGLAAAIASCRRRGVDFAVARLQSLRGQASFAAFGLEDALGDGADGRARLFRTVDEATRTLAPHARVLPTGVRAG